jgi:hypothetical protein
MLFASFRANQSIEQADFAKGKACYVSAHYFMFALLFRFLIYLWVLVRWK